MLTKPDQHFCVTTTTSRCQVVGIFDDAVKMLNCIIKKYENHPKLCIHIGYYDMNTIDVDPDDCAGISADDEDGDLIYGNVADYAKILVQVQEQVQKEYDEDRANWNACHEKD